MARYAILTCHGEHDLDRAGARAHRARVRAPGSGIDRGERSSGLRSVRRAVHERRVAASAERRAAVRPRRDHRVIQDASAQSHHAAHLHEHSGARGLPAIGARNDLRRALCGRLVAEREALRREVRSSDPDRRARGSIPADDGRLANRGTARAVRDAHVNPSSRTTRASRSGGSRGPRNLVLLAFIACAALPACDRGGERPSEPQASDPPVAAVESRAARIAAESARLTEWLDARYEEQLDFSPMEKTRLGRKDDYDEIDDFSESAVDAELDWLRRSVDELRASFDYALLDPEAQTSYDVWVYRYEQAEAARPFLRREYVFEQMGGAQAWLPQFLINFHAVETEADMEAYIARVGGVSRAVRQLLERARLAAAEGVRPPRFAYEGALEQARAIVAGEPFEGSGMSPLFADATSKIDGLLERGVIGGARAGAFRAAVREALLAELEPAYDALIRWLETDMPNADEVATGVWRLPDGEAFYRQRLEEATTTTLSAEEIHEIGLREVARIHAEMEAVK